MKCPKCDHEQVSKIECERCGVIFEKFFKIQEHRRRIEASADNRPVQPSSEKKQVPRLHLILGLVIAIGLCFGGYYYGLNTSERVKTAHEETGLVEPSPSMDAAESPREMEEAGVAGRLNEFKQPKNNIEKGQIATVFIQTPWGLGSGFFIDEECRIFTNKHVIQFDEAEFIKLEQQIALLEEMIEKEENNLGELNRLKYGASYSQYGDEIERNIQVVQQNMDVHKEQLAQLTTLSEEIQTGAESSGYKVLLFDESEYSIESISMSEKHDIALLKLDLENCPSLSPNFAPLEIGQRVYTIGNPLGLSHTVTSGIISGERQDAEVSYIQTDAPINRGNSGGPLIDEEGRVVGINTMILKDTEGIGFALPIEFAMNEFGLLD